MINYQKSETGIAPRVVLKQQRDFFNSGASLDPQFRISHLRKLKTLIKSNEELFYQAIEKDFGKCRYETYLTELGVVYKEIDLFIKMIPQWVKPIKVKDELANIAGKSYRVPEPLGCTLIISPWNYPIQLALLPLIASIGAGNTVLLKPSEITANCSALISKLLNENFDTKYIKVFEGGQEITEEILKLKFDKIFFTGSTHVGKLIYKAAAENLTPVTLELGGKSPAFVLEDADLRMAARRIVWGKFINAGQTCIAPDYILVHRSVKNTLLEYINEELKDKYKENDTYYVRIINEKHFDRISALIDEDKVYIRGRINRDKLYIGPTVLDNVKPDDKIMQEEIFGPVLPVLDFDSLQEALGLLRGNDKPLAFYIFSKNKKIIREVLGKVSFGGATVNDTLLHFSNKNLPFGGVGASGIGSYHGEAGFVSFSHYKSVMEVPLWLDPFLKYPPYTDFKFKLIRFLFEGFK